MTTPLRRTHSNLSEDGVDLAPQVRIQDARFHLMESWLVGETCEKGKLEVAKVLGALLDCAPNEEGRLYVANAICETANKPDIMEARNALSELAEQWLRNLLYPIKAAGHKRTEAPSSYLTPTLEDTSQLIEKASQGDQKALAQGLHLREGNRCCISGVLSKRGANVNSAENVSDVQAAHILPFSLNMFNDSSITSVMDSAIMWDMLKSWAAADIQQWVGSRINNVENAILLRSHLHSLFGDFLLWLEPQDTPNAYTIKTFYGSDYRDLTVRFQDHSKKTRHPLPLPDRTAIELHAAFAKVLHASGAAEHFENVGRDDSAPHVLAKDGTSDISIALSGLWLGRMMSVP